MRETTPNPGNESQQADLPPQIQEKESKPTPESFEAQRKRARQYLEDSFNNLFGARMGRTYANSNEDGFSGDGASLYVIVSMQNEKGEEIPELVKVGWGEFSKETFEGDQFPAFRNFPYDIYCISQGDSYFADPKKIKKITENPKQFLSEHSLFVASNGKVQKSEMSTHRLNKVIQAIPYDEMLRTVRNQILNERTTPQEFATFLRELPDDVVALGKYTSDLERRVKWMSNKELDDADEKTRANVRKKHLMYILWEMGTERSGIAVGDNKAMEGLLALKNQFDFKSNSFK